MRLKIIMTVLSISILLVACNDDESTSEKSLSKDTTDIKELVQDYSVGEITDQTASITSEQLIITDNDGKESVYGLPEEEFFVSIAPYVNQTHPCENHSLTGCQGEMVNEEFDIYIEDMEGNVIHDEKMNTQANGFIDFWLPRDKTYRVEITYEGKQVESEISTFENDGTCITTMQLT